MKKLLALVLALVMSMSLVTISSADFKDADKINADYQEAVDVMYAVGVLKGDDNSNFNPQKELTRAEAAKILSYLLLGNKTAEALTGNAAFTDLAGAQWAAGYIGYCATTGIVSGNGDGTFSPAGQLTGFQFAKMLLVALGYDANVEGFTGTSWQINVSKIANQVGLFEGLNISGNAALTREQAAQMCLNTLKAPLVEYSNKGGSLTINGAQINVGASNAEYKTSSTKLSAQTIYANELNSSSGKYIVEFAEQYYSDLVLKSDQSDDFGRPAHTWLYNNEEIGTYVDTDLLSVEYTAEAEGKEIYSDINYKSIKDYTVSWFVDGVEQTSANTKTELAKITKTSDKDAFASGNGVLTQVFVDDDAEDIIVVTINTYLAKVTSDYSAKNENLKAIVYKSGELNKTVKLENVENVANFEKDDFVLVTMANGVVMSVAEAEVIEGTTITSYSTRANDIKDTTTSGDKMTKITVAGTKYEAAEAAYYDKDALTNYKPEKLDDVTYNVYLDKYGYVIGLEEAEAASKYVFVASYKIDSDVLGKNNDKATLIFTDGTMKTCDVKLDDDLEYKTFCEKVQETTPVSTKSVNKWFKYSMDGDVYVLDSIVTDQTEDKDTTAINDKNTTVKNDENKYVYGNAKSVYITVKVDDDDKDWITDVDAVSTGIKNTDIDVPAADGAIYAMYEDGYVTYAVVIGEDSSSSNRYVYITSNAVVSKDWIDKDTKYVYTFDAIINGELTTVQIKSGAANSVESNKLYKITYDGNGYGKEVKLVKGSTSSSLNTQYLKDNEVYASYKAEYTVTAEGATLYLKDDTNNGRYAVLDDECVFFVKNTDEDNGGNGEWQQFSNVDSALAELGVGQNTLTGVAAILANKDSGYATTVIFCDNKYEIEADDEDSGETVVGDLKVSLKVSQDGKGLTLVTENLKEAASYKVIAKDIRSGNTGVVNSGDIAANANYTKVLENTDSTTTYTVQLTVGNKTVSVSL